MKLLQKEQIKAIRCRYHRGEIGLEELLEEVAKAQAALSQDELDGALRAVLLLREQNMELVDQIARLLGEKAA